MPLDGTYSVEDVAILNARRTPIQKQPETLLCLVGLSRRYFLGDDVYPIFLHGDGREMDLYNLISALNPVVIKTGTRPRTAHERSPLDFSNENPSEQINEGDGAKDQGPKTMAFVVPPAGPSSTMGATPNFVKDEETAADAPLVRKGAARGQMRSPMLTPRRRLGASSTVSAPASQETPAGIINPNPISSAKPSSIPEQDIAQSSKGATVAGGPEPDPTSPTMVVSPGSIYQREWGVTNGCLLDTPSSCQELLRLRFEQEAKPLRKSVAQVARRDQRIQAMEGKNKNLETLLEAEADMRKAAKAKNAELVKEMESLRAQFIKLQVSRDGISHQVSTLQAQVTGEEKIKVVFEEFKKYEDERVSARCADMDSRLDALSIDFDEELYPHMLTAIAGRRWVIGHDLRLAVLKCAESLELRHTFAKVVSTGITKGFCDGLKYGVEQGEAKLDLSMVEGYDPEAEGKFIATMQALKDLKYPLIDELEKPRDAPMDLKIPVYPEVRDPQDPWAVKEEMLLEDAIEANVSSAEKKNTG
ncbi:hypothetical protein Tco_0318747 [Tanacetum coccineum]